MVSTTLIAFGLAAIGQGPVPIQISSKRWSPIVNLSRGRAPVRVELSTERPSWLAKIPAVEGTAHYGKLRIGPRTGGRDHAVLVDFSPKTAKMYFDTNANGDLTDDPDVDGKWTTYDDGSWGIFAFAPVFVKYDSSMKSGFMALSIYSPVKDAPLKEMTAMTLFGYEGALVAGNEQFAFSMEPIGIAGDFSTWEYGKGFTLNIDRNGNRKVDSMGETFSSDRPLNIGGVSYEIKRIDADGTFEFGVSEKSVDEVPVSPNLARGFSAPVFETKGLDGKTLRFPQDFRGKVVLLDFWATWCGPCVGEIPTLKKAYSELKPKGLEILSISADKLVDQGKAKEMISKEQMGWQHTFDGGTAGPLAMKYGVNSWPTYLLVDGDTGVILAENDTIRPDIGRALALALKRKFGK